MRLTVRLLIGIALVPSSLFAAAEAPDANEQLTIYEINRMRNDPGRYQRENSKVVKDDLSGIAPKPPLAVSNGLVGSGSFHAKEMLDNNYFGHTSAVTGDQPNKMARDNGYPLTDTYGNNANNIESIAKVVNIPDTVRYMLRLLIQDEGISGKGHRVHLLAMNPFFDTHREIGVGVAFSGKTYLMAIHTAFSQTTDLFLTGVAYSDNNKNGRYDLNEGLGSVTVSIGGTSTTTNPAGGWSIPVTNGNYTVTASGGTFTGSATRDVTVNGSNMEIDFASGRLTGELNFESQSGSGAGSDTGSTSPDTDGDGFFDSTETAAGSGPNDINSTPFGTQPAGSPQSLPPAKLAIALNFSGTSGKDGIKLSGTVPVPDNFVFDQKKVIIDVGGIARAFTLDAKGTAKPDKMNSLKITKPKASVAKFSLAISKSDFGGAFVDESLMNTTVSAVTRHVTVVIVINNAVYSTNQLQSYSAKADKGGKTK